MLVRVCLALLFVFLATGCQGKESPAEESPGATQTQEATPETAGASQEAGAKSAGEAAPTEPAPAAAPPEPKLPEPKAYTNPDEEALGTLPEGIGLAVGESVPEFRAENIRGEDVTSQELMGKAPLLVVFYRGGW